LYIEGPGPIARINTKPENLDFIRMNNLLGGERLFYSWTSREAGRIDRIQIQDAREFALSIEMGVKTGMDHLLASP
jgi:hypothetical protein